MKNTEETKMTQTTNKKVTTYAPGWDIENLRKVVIKEVNDNNKTNLKIRLGNCNEDIAKLSKNIDELAEGTAEDKAWIRAYANTVEEITKIREYIKYSLTKIN